MPLFPLALAAGLLPIITIHLCYWLAATSGHVAACIPYVHSCTTISSAGRHGAEFYLFKGLMIPAAVIIFFFWLAMGSWLKTLGSRHCTVIKLIWVFGFVASAGLILYTVALGAIGSEFRVQRRIGVITFFSLSFIVQIMVFICLRQLRIQMVDKWLHVLQAQLAIISLFAVSAVIISTINSDFYDGIEDAFEWWVTSLLCLFPLVVARLWWQTGFYISAGCKP